MSANIVSIDRLLRRSRDWSAQELAEARTDGDHKATDDEVNDGRATTIRFAGSKGPEIGVPPDASDLLLKAASVI
jgi:hypothetical protein